jgi:hypothetical protein
VWSLPSRPLIETYSPGKKGRRAELVTGYIVIILVRIIVENPPSMFSATRLMHETTDFVVLACPESPNPAVVTILLPENRIDVSYEIEGAQ